MSVVKAIHNLLIFNSAGSQLILDNSRPVEHATEGWVISLVKKVNKIRTG